MMKKYTLQEEVSTTSDGSSNVDLKLSNLPNNFTINLQHVCVGNMTNAGSRCDVGVITGGAINWITTISCTSDDYFYSWNGGVHIKSCKTVILRFKATNAGDVLKGYVYGYYEE